MSAERGRPGLAYEPLLQGTSPSWLGPLDKEAATIGEEGDGVGSEGRPRTSYSHCGKGAVVSSLRRYVAGIRLPRHPDAGGAGHRRFVIGPRSGSGLTSASARHSCPHDVIRSAWRLGGSALRPTADVPPGVEAGIRLPGGTRAPAGHAHVHDAGGVTGRRWWRRSRTRPRAGR